MTPQEQQLLMSLTQRVNQTQLEQKDQDAENLLGRELGANPDAVYILAQTVLVQNIALDQARAQVNQLQQQVQQARQQPQHSTSFLGRLLGEHDPTPLPAQQPPYQPVQQQYAPPPPPQPQYAPAQYQPVQYAPAGQPSFLRGAMQTAAGVAAGALAFEGVESILHGFGHSGYQVPMAGFGMGPGMGMGGGFERPVEENVVNNYYGEPGSQGAGNDNQLHDASGFAPTGDLSGAQFSDAGYNTQGGVDTQSGYDAGSDNSTMDDASAAYDNSADYVQIDDSQQDQSFDDGGGFGGDDSGSVV